MAAGADGEVAEWIRALVADVYLRREPKRPELKMEPAPHKDYTAILDAALDPTL